MAYIKTARSYWYQWGKGYLILKIMSLNSKNQSKINHIQKYALIKQNVITNVLMKKIVKLILILIIALCLGLIIMIGWSILIF